VLASAKPTALRTRDGRSRWFDNQNQTAVAHDDDQNDAPAVRYANDSAIELTLDGHASGFMFIWAR
jgi:hypothetical protein